MIIQPSHDATTEPTSQVYENGAEFALQALLMWLNRDKEKFAVEQTGVESGLIVEKVEESGLTIERKFEPPSLAATPTKLENETGEDPWFQELKTHPDSQPKPSESANPNRLEISKVEPPKTEESTRLLYGIKDGKLVNNLSPAEALAVAAMVNGKPGSEIANGANLRIKFNGKVIAETDAKGNLITNEVYGKVPKEDLIEFNHRIAKIAETPAPTVDISADTPAIAAVAKNLSQAPQTPGKTFLERLFPPFGKKQQTLTPEQENIQEYLAHSGGKNEYAFKNLPQGDIVFVKTAIAFTEANTSPGNPLISPKGYIVSSELNRDRTVTYQYQTPDGKVAIEATKNPATGMVSIQQCQLTNETRQYLKDLQTTLERPPLERVQAPTPTAVVAVAAQPEIMPQSTNQVPVVERESFRPTVINPDPRGQSASQTERDLDLEQKVTERIRQQSESGESIKYYDLRSIDNNANVSVAHNFTTDTLVILNARVVQAGTEAGRQSIQGIAEYELYSPDPDGDIQMRLTYDPVADKIDIQEVNIGRDTIEMWTSLDRGVAVEKARWNALEHQLNIDKAELSAAESTLTEDPTMPTSDRAQANANYAATPQSLAASTNLDDAEREVALVGSASKLVAEAKTEKAAKAAIAKAKREQKKAETAAEASKQASTAVVPQVEVIAAEILTEVVVETTIDRTKPSTTPNQIEVKTPPALTKKEQLIAEGKAARASKTNTLKAPTKAKTAVKGGRG